MTKALAIPTTRELEALTPADRWNLEDAIDEAQGTLREFNDDELRRWVEDEGKTQTEIAETVGRSQSDIQRRCDKIGAKPKSKRGRPRITQAGNSAPEPSDPDDDIEDAEVVDGEVVEDRPGLPSGMERVDHGTLRSVVNNLTAQARTAERLLDDGFTVESLSPEDKASVTGDMDRVLSVATRVKEAITEEASSANDA